ncbi:hypothetical protein DFH07DRAFT_1064898 [Mycena maculata]|uniref:Uncharacterized protein n=1 Tax=Mycena maculata TaxID=230809 RepID=A0AAD7I8Z7_9AGAR|nr:hypothetical protein DFH07DRAFT_1064898 [Mycena maculata]
MEIDARTENDATGSLAQLRAQEIEIAVLKLQVAHGREDIEAARKDSDKFKNRWTNTQRELETVCTKYEKLKQRFLSQSVKRKFEGDPDVDGRRDPLLRGENSGERAAAPTDSPTDDVIRIKLDHDHHPSSPEFPAPHLSITAPALPSNVSALLPRKTSGSGSPSDSGAQRFPLPSAARSTNSLPPRPPATMNFPPEEERARHSDRPGRPGPGAADPAPLSRLGYRDARPNPTRFSPPGRDGVRRSSGR